jgi:hypothetical protein
MLRLLFYDVRAPFVDAFLKMGSEFPPIEGTKRYPAIDLEIRVTYGRVRLVDRFIYCYGIERLPAEQTLVDLLGVIGVNAVLSVDRHLPRSGSATNVVPNIILLASRGAPPVLVVGDEGPWALECDMRDPKLVMAAYQLIRDQLESTEARSAN